MDGDGIILGTGGVFCGTVEEEPEVVLDSSSMFLCIVALQLSVVNFSRTEVLMELFPDCSSHKWKVYALSKSHLDSNVKE